MSESIAQVVAAYLEHNGDKYDLSNSASIKVLAMDIQEAIDDAGFYLSSESCCCGTCGL